MFYQYMPTVLLLVVVAGCGAPPDVMPPSAAPSPAPVSMATEKATTQTTPAEASAPAAKTTQIVIDTFAFSPRELTIVPGTRVTWVNRDDVPHTATSSIKPRTFDSGALDTDATFSFVFKVPGSYDYFCAVHPHMTGKVIVK